ncbi:MAG: hypothetical protein A2626_02685 [Candidatus Nealsonbacteria bacterium RIFCSPHIGHO2_01_FULL_38_55]|uniref:Cell division protein FtsX n=2 Tax=Candidatus Nealsoniibacteriota TaxID=1817911 RepID=A0A1G2EHL6_9BACT|nr:MAG: Cell division protein [Parcubacteria group bacterium GW2011_GWA2_38_27]KKQ97062.1 MAG: Cell division protein [Parcubacteria group bacterium GW2011_GWC2_39_11]OGZ19617.1 MAG: hypothetical protein A2626_02685 [Candidatus Nealsonbacteria bacterium RIFCSPHIGHO2_01_FULL_38_55]OGZ20846.1 MAG: hypothetical protein A3C48_00315 [Candidatus Nealsonbacteria bacterium RIFCSPHIGHO2_02_FULL_38_75]OGZ20875.1 MAG: hypothetical protein A2W55_03070 [Candidatus Nealsonbacteria bacterium RIFCSPHIGHO2_02_38
MFISLKRVIKAGWKNFVHNIGLNSAAIFITAMVISLISFLFILAAASQILISNVQEKIDVSVYFKEDVSSENILQAKSEISGLPEVKNVSYVSKEQALEDFVQKHKDDPVLMESLTEIGYNPFLSYLNIEAEQAQNYEQIAYYLKNGEFEDLIDSVDYNQRKEVIDKVFSITSVINKIGIIFSIVLGSVAVLVIFNTIKIAIAGSGEEISTMRLVGASNWFAKGPFLIQGLIVGIGAFILAFIVILSVCWSIDIKMQSIIPSVGAFNLLVSNIWLVLLIQFLTGVCLSSASAVIAIGKYLKV